MEKHNSKVVIINRYRNCLLDTAAKALNSRNISASVLCGISEDSAYEAPKIVITDVFSEREIEFCLNACSKLKNKPYLIILSPYSALIRKYQRMNDPHAVFLAEPAEISQIVDAVCNILVNQRP